jgi:formylglycine-generating enzyme required for sulfatase activity
MVEEAGKDLKEGGPDIPTPDQGVPVTPKWVTVKAGTFKMGSPTSESCRNSDETQHHVTLTHKFEIQSTEVTQGQFKALMGYNPSKFPSCGINCPVEGVSWHTAAAYCNALSKKRSITPCYLCSGAGANVVCQETTATQGKGIYSCLGFRLPTEAEWEYSYRAGTSTAFYSGGITNCSSADANADKIGWYTYNSKVQYSGCSDLSNAGGDKCSGPHPGGKKGPNIWGLHDMAGNVHEWCHDNYQKALGTSATTDPVGSTSGLGRVVRGGSWHRPPGFVRAADRYTYMPTGQSSFLGFRCVRTLIP